MGMQYEHALSFLVQLICDMEDADIKGAIVVDYIHQRNAQNGLAVAVLTNALNSYATTRERERGTEIRRLVTLMHKTKPMCHCSLMYKSTSVLLEQLEAWMCYALLCDDYQEFFIEQLPAGQHESWYESRSKSSIRLD